MLLNQLKVFISSTIGKKIVVATTGLLFCLFLLENLSRQKAKYHFNSKGGFKQKEKIKLEGNKAFFASLFCFLIFLASQMIFKSCLFD